MTSTDEFAIKLINHNLARLEQDPADTQGLTEAEWRDGVAWAQTMAETIRNHPESFVTWVGKALAGRA